MKNIQSNHQVTKLNLNIERLRKQASKYAPMVHV